MRIRCRIWAEPDSPRIKVVVDTDFSLASHSTEFALNGLYIEVEADDLDKALDGVREKLILFLEIEAKPRVELVRKAASAAKSITAEVAERIAATLGEVGQ
ncbi:MAG: hypothetical protein QXT73_08870 [Candidatus Methanomethylicaceae archaeon]